MITSKQISGNRDRACFSIRLIHSSYFANPVKPGATTEQAKQIEQNKTDITSLKAETNSLKEDLGNIISPNLFNPTDAKENTAINQDDGTEMSFDGWLATGYIPCLKNDVLYFSSNEEPIPYSTGAFYDKNKQRVDSFGNPNNTGNLPSSYKATLQANLSFLMYVPQALGRPL